MNISLTKQEYEQLRVDIEGARQELEMLSSEISWYATELPERLTVVLEIIERASA